MASPIPAPDPNDKSHTIPHSPTPPPHTTNRLPAHERRAAILNAAIDLFSSRGFRGTTTREIAAAVGVTEPVLYQHFATKRALYDAILQSKVAELPAHAQAQLDQAAEAGDTRALFTGLGRIFLDWYLNDPRYARLLMFASLETNELAQMFYERQVVVFYDFVTRYLTRQMELGHIRPVDPMLAARAFAGMLSHQGLIFAIYKCGDLQGTRDSVVETVVNIFLNGIETNHA